jgi:hypothetical protein
MFQNDLKRWRGALWRSVPGVRPDGVCLQGIDSCGFCVGESSPVKRAEYGEKGAASRPSENYLARYMKGKMVLVHHLSEWL